MDLLKKDEFIRDVLKEAASFLKHKAPPPMFNGKFWNFPEQIF